MQAPTFYVVLEGATAPRGDATAVNAQLAHLIKRTPEQAEALLQKAPVTLKRGLSAELADKYVHALSQAGVRARKVSEASQTLALVEDSSETPPMSIMDCPKCGQQQPKAVSCSACGIVVEKYLARQRQLTPNAPEPSPYATPDSALIAAPTQVGELNPFNSAGRIGRVRYIGWMAGATYATMGLYLLSLLLISAAPLIGGLMAIAVVLGSLVLSTLIIIQRLHDLDWSGWLTMLMIVPIANLLLAIILLFAPGHESINRYGPPPPSNSTGVKLLALSCLLLPIILAFATVQALRFFPELT